MSYWPATQPGGISSLKLILWLKSLKFRLSVGGSLRNAVARGAGGRRGRGEEGEGRGRRENVNCWFKANTP